MSLTYEYSKLSAMPDDVRSDVGKGRNENIQGSIGGN
jgi:hypothetical protein